MLADVGVVQGWTHRTVMVAKYPETKESPSVLYDYYRGQYPLRRRRRRDGNTKTQCSSRRPSRRTFVRTCRLRGRRGAPHRGGRVVPSPDGRRGVSVVGATRRARGRVGAPTRTSVDESADLGPDLGRQIGEDRHGTPRRRRRRRRGPEPVDKPVWASIVVVCRQAKRRHTSQESSEQQGLRQRVLGVLGCLLAVGRRRRHRPHILRMVRKCAPEPGDDVPFVGVRGESPWHRPCPFVKPSRRRRRRRGDEDVLAADTAPSGCQRRHLLPRGQQGKSRVGASCRWAAQVDARDAARALAREAERVRVHQDVVSRLAATGRHRRWRPARRGLCVGTDREDRAGDPLARVVAREDDDLDDLARRERVAQDVHVDSSHHGSITVRGGRVFGEGGLEASRVEFV
mmetsp:Transcript_18606/g.74285  ORF Transcript_18606/g.74285 Transcript_18606/m.74285 type:complete len:400 (-) Transcript_18606:725-1924(-)